MRYLCGVTTGVFDGRSQTRPLARNTRCNGLEDIGGHGRPPWIRNCASPRAGERERSPAESRDDLRVTGAIAAARLDRGRVGHFRPQPQSEILLHYEGWSEAVGAGHRILATARRSGGAGSSYAGRRKRTVNPSLREAVNRVRSFFREDLLDQEFDEEVASHLEM